MIGGGSRPLSAAVLAAAALTAGCSAIPPGGDAARDDRVVALARVPRAKLGQVAVAPVASVSLAVDEAAKGWTPSQVEALASEGVRREVARALEATGGWDAVRLGTAASPAEAWRERDDWVLSVEIAELRTKFDGRNGWWIPNIVNFLLNTPFAWWVATEEYSLSLEARVTVASGETGEVVGRSALPIRSHGTFDEFDRGWQLLGPIVSSLDAEGWRGIASRLFPEARRELAAQVALESERLLREARENPGFADSQRKTLVLAVGVGGYEDPRAMPPVPFAREDALRVATAFDRLGSLPQHVVALTDDAATVAAVSSRIAEHLGRAREGDSVVFWFSGYGTRRADGKPALLLHDSSPGSGVALEELARTLAALPGDKLLVVDAAFSGGARAIGSGSKPSDPRADAALAGAEGVSVLLAARPGEGALAPEHLRSGLLTFHALRALERLGRGSDGDAGTARRRVALRELFAAVEPAVTEDAEFLGSAQVPVLEETARRFGFALGHGGSP